MVLIDHSETPETVYKSTLRNTPEDQRSYNNFAYFVILYGCETLSLTYRLWVFENRVLRKIFGPRADEVRGEWRTLHAQ